MANKNLKSLSFPGLEDTYKINQIAEEYSSLLAYSEGDYCNRNGEIYRCKTGSSSGEEWTASHWTLVHFASEVTRSRAAIDALQGSITSVYTQLREIFEDSGQSAAVAVLDAAILDLDTLG